MRFKDHSDDVLRQLRRVEERAVGVATLVFLEDANRTAPQEETTLIRSGDTDVETHRTRVVGTLGYNTPYARRQHEAVTVGEFVAMGGGEVEDPTRAGRLVHHDPGRRAKWLELTGIEEGDRYIDVMGQELRAGMGG